MAQASGNQMLAYFSMASRRPVVSAPSHEGWPGLAYVMLKVSGMLL
ncbi:hypothetical protein OG524_02650 [Streptomyces sp. NBC_01520]